LKDDPVRCEYFTELCRVLHTYLGEIQDLSVSDLFDIFGKVYLISKVDFIQTVYMSVLGSHQQFLNNFSVGHGNYWNRSLFEVELLCKWFNTYIAVIIFYSMSILDHSCDPDCVISFQGPNAILNSIKQRVQSSSPLNQVVSLFLTFNDQNYKKIIKLTISYVELLRPTKERQYQLKSQYYFACKCPICLDVVNVHFETWYLEH